MGIVEIYPKPENGVSCRGILKEFLNRRFRAKYISRSRAAKIVLMIAFL